MSGENALWIGGLEKYMSEEFLKEAFRLMGEDSVESVEIIKNKFTRIQTSYGFIHFDSDTAAMMVMHKLNNKIIPHSQPPVRFQLKHASANKSGTQFREGQYSIWVSELPTDITEEIFKKTFSTRFESLKTAKIFHGKDHKVYGFVRFTDLNDQRDALIHMNGFRGLGKKPIRVTVAIPKRSLVEATNNISTTYSDMFSNHLTDQNSWTNFGTSQGVSPAIIFSYNINNSEDLFENDEDSDKDEERLIDHNGPVLVEAMNTEYFARSQEVWDSIEADQWFYNLDMDEGILPDFNSTRNKSRK